MVDQALVEYRPIEDFPGYRVGSDGTVWTSWRRGNRPIITDVWRRLKPWNVNGYLMVSLRAGKEVKRDLVHRLVLIAFVGECPKGKEACHDPDPDRSNCRLSNLRWDTRKANHADKIKHGTAQRGENHFRSRLTVEDVLKIRQMRIDGAVYDLIARHFEIDRSTVCQIVNRKTWKHV